MPVETEVKIHLTDMEEFLRRLERFQPQLLSARHFEDNFVLDYPDGSLRARGCLLRVRKTQHKESVTFKGPTQTSPLFKTREELETRVDSAEVVLKILQQMGMMVWFRYQKFRAEYRMPVSTGPDLELHLSLDSTPVGDYIELEGSEAGIREVAARLGIAEAQFLRDSYYSLFVRFCQQQGRQPGHMVFPGRE